MVRGRSILGGLYHSYQSGDAVKTNVEFVWHDHPVDDEMESILH